MNNSEEIEEIEEEFEIEEEIEEEKMEEWEKRGCSSFYEYRDFVTGKSRF